MKQTVTTAIVLTRTNYGEADRIVTILTPQGKVRLLAKGVRKIKSKLAGGVELFSVSEVTFLQGRGELQTLISSRLQKHFSNIAKQLDRTMVAYEIMKTINKVTEDEAEKAYFELLNNSLAVLDVPGLSTGIIELWFGMHLMQLEGRSINLSSDEQGRPLENSLTYFFSYENMCFNAGKGVFESRHIKFLRLIAQLKDPIQVRQIGGADELAEALVPLIRRVIIQQNN